VRAEKARRGGEIVLGFHPFESRPAVQITVASSHVNDPSQEALAKVFVGESPDGSWMFAGIASNWANAGQSTFSIPVGHWQYLRLQDVTTSVGSVGGFDLNSINVTEVPTPTAAVGGATLLALMAVPKIRQLRRKSFDMSQ